MDRHPIKPLRGKKENLQYGLDFAEMNELVVALNSQELYVANGHDGGVKICDIIVLNLDTERTAIVSPINGKFYYVINDNALWFYNNGWTDLRNTSEELERQTNEENRQNAEYVRIQNESTRQTQEYSRQLTIVNLRYVSGGYVSTTQYYKNNIIGYQGAAYIALQDTIGHAPTLNTSNDYWGLLGTKGDPGDGTGDMTKSQFATNAKVGSGYVDKAIMADSADTLKGKTANTTLNTTEKTDLATAINEVLLLANSSSYTLPIASDTTLGGVKSGTDIAIDANGNVSVNDNSHGHTLSNISDYPSTNCVKSGTIPSAIGDKNAALTNYSYSEGQYNLACDGTIYKITTFNNTAKTITLDNVSGLSVGNLLQIKVFNNVSIADIAITAINGTVVTLNTTATIDVNWTNAVKKNTSPSPTHAEGSNTRSIGSCSHAEGYATIASGSYSHSGGYVTTASVYDSSTMGQYNKALTGSATSYSGTADAFVIGNGTSSSALGNAFRVTFDGKVYGLSAFNSTGADYAEYFEWLDGNTNSEDRVGYFVTLDGEKIKKATSIDTYILGIVSAMPSVIGDSYQDDWNEKYIKDAWGRIQYTTIDVPAVTNEEGNIIIPAHTDTVPQLNPNWNPNEEYIPRERRKEWSAIGMIGKLLVRDDGTCQVNSFCKSNDEGIATTSSTGYRVIKRVSSNIIQILLK